MSNFYDLETDLEVEDVEQDEDFDDDSEFGEYDAEEAKARWGRLDFTELLNELETYVATSKKFFFSKRKRVVNGEDLTHLVQYIHDKLPGEISQAKGIIANKDTIIANAQQESDHIVSEAKAYYKDTTQAADVDADKIIKRAQAQAEEMVAAHSITQAARVRAEEIKDNCQKEMNELVAKTNADCENFKAQAREWAVKATDGSYNFICDALSKYQKIAMDNLNQIGSVYENFQGEYQNHKNMLMAEPSVQPKN